MAVLSVDTGFVETTTKVPYKDTSVAQFTDSHIKNQRSYFSKTIFHSIVAKNLTQILFQHVIEKNKVFGVKLHYSCME